MMKTCLTIAALLLATPAFAASAGEVRAADRTVAVRVAAVRKAEATGDAASIAAERAALKAAQAVAWGKRQADVEPAGSTRTAER